MGCPRCMEIDRQRYEANSPRTKVLRFLERSDWVTSVELLDTFDPVNRAEWSGMVSRLVSEGLVERRKVHKTLFEYRIAQQKRRAA